MTKQSEEGKKILERLQTGVQAQRAAQEHVHTYFLETVLMRYF